MTSDHIAMQIRGRDLAATSASLQKLLNVELATLVLLYRRVPNSPKRSLLSNTSAKDSLLDGLRAVAAQLDVIHAALARDDMFELASQARYLQLAAAEGVAPTKAPEQIRMDSTVNPIVAIATNQGEPS